MHKAHLLAILLTMLTITSMGPALMMHSAIEYLPPPTSSHAHTVEAIIEDATIDTSTGDLTLKILNTGNTIANITMITLWVQGKGQFAIVPVSEGLAIEVYAGRESSVKTRGRASIPPGVEATYTVSIPQLKGLGAGKSFTLLVRFNNELTIQVYGLTK